MFVSMYHTLVLNRLQGNGASVATLYFYGTITRMRKKFNIYLHITLLHIYIHKQLSRHQNEKQHESSILSSWMMISVPRNVQHNTFQTLHHHRTTYNLLHLHEDRWLLLLLVVIFIIHVVILLTPLLPCQCSTKCHTKYCTHH